MRLTGHGGGGFHQTCGRIHFRSEMSAFVVKNALAGPLCAERFWKCITFVKSQKSRTGLLKLTVSAEESTPTGLILLQSHLLLMYVRLSFRKTRPWQRPCSSFPPKLRPSTSPFDWASCDWRCVMRPRSSHIHHDVTVSNPDLNYLRLASFQHML